MTTAVVSYIYPKVLAFLPAFIESLSKQTDQHFELLIFNDGVDSPEKYFYNSYFKPQFFSVTGSPLEIRFQSFKILHSLSYSNFIFQDADDCMSENRVAKSKELLNHYSFVCNDLVLMDDNGTVSSKSSWSERLVDGFEFDYSFIADKNIAGLGNSAIRKSLLDNPIYLNGRPLAPDWFIFYQLLYSSKAKAVFTSGCTTLYRQHENNSAGLKKVDESRLNLVIDVCKQHYAALKEIGYESISVELPNTLKAEQLLKSKNYNYNSPVKYGNLYWWEEKNYLYEKN